MTESDRAIQNLYVTAIGHASDVDLNAEEQSELRDHVREIHSPPDVTAPDNFGDHLVRHIRETYQESDPDERRELLYSGGNPDHPLLKGKLPVELRSPRWTPVEDTITKADAIRYVQRTPDAVAVRDAIKAWDKARGETEERLWKILALTGHQSVDEDDLHPERVPGVDEGAAD